MKSVLSILVLAAAISFSSMPVKANNTDLPNLKIAFTTDVHGNFFPFNFITLTDGEGSLARVATAIDSLRHEVGDENFLLLDNGDILQGQPTAYYYNFIDTESPHIVSEIYNYMGYDATTVGNHDIETGHHVYDRVRKQNRMPMLAANVIDEATGQPYFQPYAIFNRGGMKIAVLGLLTPAIPSWLPEELWEGMRFEDMTESAKKWIKIINQNEKPDIIIGLFHSGHDENKTTGNTVENASVKVAREVPGFTAVLMGHDHQRYNRPIVNIEGKKVSVINPANNARAIGIVDVTKGATSEPKATAYILDVTNCVPSSDFLRRFNNQKKEVLKFVERQIGTATADMSTHDAFFGPSAFMTLLHKLQLEISGADISFAAPLSFDAQISKGPVRVSDMFTLYKYENMLYVLELTGKEIKNYLEESYNQWTARLTPENSHIIRFASESPDAQNNRLSYPSYNFDSADGIIYTVDVTKPKGSKINIISLADGKPFDMAAKYTVAVNSYRANGGGNLLTDGAGIPADSLSSRVIRATDKDLRYYLIQAIEQNPIINVATAHNWKFIPEETAEKAIAIDREILFSPASSKEQK